MTKQEQSLAIDIGSTGVRITEFEYSLSGAVILQSFSIVEFTEQLTESNRTDVIAAALREAYETGSFTTKKASICVSGQAAFMRFVNLPPVSEEEARIKQIVEYEARQNVPFPMDEVIWDYQLLSGAEEDLEVMFVVIKHDIVESVTEAVIRSGLRPQLVDFAPSALYNVSRANHIGDSGCSMVLNIGGRCSTLLFLDGQRFFARTIPIGGFSITQQVAKEFGISNEEAETLKRRHGFVALGGAYEEPESEVAATISKIVRNVMTRLHGEVNRSISVYRTQQKGNKPSHLFLSGGSSTMPFTENFFSEKLRMEVSYLNPFKVVTMGESMNLKQLETVAHVLPETVGVGLRGSLECPVEISLVPESIKKQESFSSRKPFIIGSCCIWFAILSVFILVKSRTVSLNLRTITQKKVNVERLNKIKTKIEALHGKQKKTLEKYNSVKELIEQRYSWSHLLNSLQAAKPQDVWLASINRLGAPKVGGKKGKKKSPKKDLFGNIQKKKSKKAKKGDAVWFDVVGFAIAIPSENPSRKIFTDEQIADFEFLLADFKKIQLQALEEGDGKDLPTKEEVLEYQGFWRDNVMKPDYILSEVFLEALQWSELISDDPDETRIIETNFSETHRNLTTFRIQIRLEDPIVLKR